VSRRPLVLAPQPFGSTVFDRRTSRYLPFDHEATALLRAARDVSADRLVARESDPERREALAAFVEHFVERGLFTVDLRFAGDVLDVVPPTDALLGPLAVHLEVVAACNLACTHCFAGTLPRRDRPLDLVELDPLFATFARMGSFRLGLTGGEPTLRPDLVEVVDLALAHGLAPCLTTNGHFLRDSLARALAARELAWLNVNLDGATAETNDRVRGAGSFERTLAGLETLTRVGGRFTLAFTLLRTNLHEVEACGRLAARLGAHSAVFRPLYPVGTAREHLDLMPTYEEYARAVETLAALRVGKDAPSLGEAHDPLAGTDLVGLDPFGPRARAATRPVLHRNIGCGAGNLVASISVGGDVSPCSFLGGGFVAANVRETPFDVIWREHPVFRDIRGLPGDERGTRAFGGGCRARSLVLAGDANAPDPWLAASARGAGLHPLAVVERRTASDAP